MKRNKFIFSALVDFVVLVLSCSKDESQNTILNSGLQTRTSTPSTINGMLSFSTYQDFENFVTNLKNQEQDSTTVRNAFISLGIDLNAEQTTNITDYPVCRLTENGISGFTSARRLEENAINVKLNGGADAFSIIDDVYLKTALNGNKSVHIGTRIFTFYDNGGVSIVLNNDWALYNTISSFNYSQLNTTQNLLVTNNDISKWSWFYNFNEFAAITTEKEVIIPEVLAIPGCDFSNVIKIVTLNDGDIRFELNVGLGSNSVEWVFSDGIILNGNPVTRKCTSSGTVRVRLRNATGILICESMNIMQYFCQNCGEKRTKKDELIRTVNGETWRIQASIWVKSKEVGCEMSYKRKRFGIWLPSSNKGVRTQLFGTYKRELANKSCLDVVVPSSAFKALGEGTYPTSISVKLPDIDKIFREPSKLSSEHRVNVKGTWFGFGVNGVPRLILD